jgi:hypothetical protein
MKTLKDRTVVDSKQSMINSGGGGVEGSLSSQQNLSVSALGPPSPILDKIEQDFNEDLSLLMAIVAEKGYDHEESQIARMAVDHAARAFLSYPGEEPPK